MPSHWRIPGLQSYVNHLGVEFSEFLIMNNRDVVAKMKTVFGAGRGSLLGTLPNISIVHAGDTHRPKGIDGVTVMKRIHRFLNDWVVWELKFACKNGGGCTASA